VTVSGHGFLPEKPDLSITFHSAPVSLGTTTSDASGAYRATVTIPADASAGAHEIVVAGPATAGGALESVTKVTVVSGSVAAAAPPAVAGRVAFTGAGIARAVLFALALCALGLVLLMGSGPGSSRRRRGRAA